MVVKENGCVGCSVDMPCIGLACPHYGDEKHYYCDHCDEEVDEGELFLFEGEELCIDCIKERLEVVE